MFDVDNHCMNGIEKFSIKRYRPFFFSILNKRKLVNRNHIKGISQKKRVDSIISESREWIFLTDFFSTKENKHTERAGERETAREHNNLFIPD